MSGKETRKEKERLFEVLAEAERNKDMDAQKDLMQQLIELNDKSRRSETDENN